MSPMKSGALRKIAPSQPLQAAKAAAQSRLRRAVFQPIANWPPRQAAKVVKPRKASDA